MFPDLDFMQKASKKHPSIIQARINANDHQYANIDLYEVKLVVSETKADILASVSLQHADLVT